MYRSFVALFLVLISIQFFSVPKASARSCEEVFEPIYQRLPKPSDLAAPRESDVRSLHGRAVLVLKVSEVLPAGRYSVIVTDKTEGRHTATLTVSYVGGLAQFMLGSTRIIENQSLPFSFGNGPSSVGQIVGRSTHMRVESQSKPPTTVVSFVTSTYISETGSTAGAGRIDTVLEVPIFPIQAPTTIALKLNRDHYSNGDSFKFQQSIEIVNRLDARQ